MIGAAAAGTRCRDLSGLAGSEAIGKLIHASVGACFVAKNNCDARWSRAARMFVRASPMMAPKRPGTGSHATRCRPPDAPEAARPLTPRRSSASDGHRGVVAGLAVLDTVDLPERGEVCLVAGEPLAREQEAVDALLADVAGHGIVAGGRLADVATAPGPGGEVRGPRRQGGEADVG